MADLATRPATPADALVKKIFTPNMVDRLKLALPKHLTPERMMSLLANAIRSKVDLSKCDEMTLVGALIQASQLGLEPNSPLHLCSIIPYGNVAQLQIEYRGLITLGMNSGLLSGVKAEVVYDRDQFAYEEGLDPKLVHKPFLIEKDGDSRGNLKFCYAIAVMKDGAKNFVVLQRDDIARIRKASRAASKADSPWNTAEGEMWKKSAIRRLFKTLSLSPELARAIELDDLEETGQVQNLPFVESHVIEQHQQADRAESVRKRITERKVSEESAPASGAGAKQTPAQESSPVAKQEDTPAPEPDGYDSLPPEDEPPAELPVIALADAPKQADKAEFQVIANVKAVKEQTTKTGRKQVWVELYEKTVVVSCSTFGSKPEWAVKDALVIVTLKAVDVAGRIYLNLVDGAPYEPGSEG